MPMILWTMLLEHSMKKKKGRMLYVLSVNQVERIEAK